LNSRTKYLIAGASGLVVAVVAIWFVFFRDTAPDAVNLDDAVGAVTSTTAAPATPTTSSSDTAPDQDQPTDTAELDGTWVIDTTIGAGSVEDGSFVGYRVKEELASILTAATVVADLTGLTSDSRGRDGQMRTQSLETNTFPEATFVLTAPVDLGTAPAEGESFSVQAQGDLTIHGVTRAVAVPIDGQLTAGIVVVVGRIEILFADYDIDKPEALRVLSVEDTGEMEFQLFLARS
jgi:polyisoprenoid-binding protein YceI